MHYFEASAAMRRKANGESSRGRTGVRFVSVLVPVNWDKRGHPPQAPELSELTEGVLAEYGEAGIRTRDRDLTPYNGLANRRLQPLGHLSGHANAIGRSGGRQT